MELTTERRRKAAAALCAAMLLIAPIVVVTADESEDSDVDAFAPLLILAAGVAIGVIASVLTDTYVVDLSSLINDEDEDATVYDEEEVTDAILSLNAQLVSSNYTTATGMWSKLGTNDAQLWALLETYFDRMAEIAAASLWTTYTEYDPDKILETSGTISNALVYAYNVTSAWDEFAASWSDMPAQWIASNLNEITWSYEWDGISWASSGGDSVSSRLMMMATPSSDYGRVWIDVVDSDEDGYTDSTNLLYAMGGTGSVTSVATGESWTISEDGSIDMLDAGMTSGWYVLSEGATYLAQSMASSYSSDGLTPAACMLLTIGEGIAYAYSTSDGYAVIKDGESYATEAIGISVAWGDESYDVDLTSVLAAWTSVGEAIADAYASAVSAGAAAWEVYDALESSSVAISPSSITVGTSTSLTSSEAAAVWIAAMQQLSGADDSWSIDDLTISVESLTLVVYGDIYVNGELIAEDAIYTPFVYSDESLTVGTQTLSSDGIAMIWATGVSSYADWDGDTSAASLVTISQATLTTYAIYDDGTEVSSIDLTVDSMYRLGLIGYEGGDAVAVPDGTDITALVMIVAVLIGAILAIVGLWTSSWWAVLLGLIVALAGVAFADVIAGAIV